LRISKRSFLILSPFFQIWIAIVCCGYTVAGVDLPPILYRTRK
jgi:hypothetical protein